MPMSKLIILLAIVTIAAAATIYIGLSFNLNPALIAIISVKGAGKVLLLACGALAHEIIALKKLNGWDHLDLQCLPAIYHVHPEKIVPAVRASVAQYRESYDSIFVVYADCGTGGELEAACAELGVAMVAGPHCYSFFEGNDTFAARNEMTKFYLTDFLARSAPGAARYVFRELHWPRLSSADQRSCLGRNGQGVCPRAWPDFRVPFHWLRRS